MRIPPPVIAFFAGIAGIALATATMHEPAPQPRERETPAVEAPAPPDACQDPLTQAFVSLHLEAGALSDLTLDAAPTIEAADIAWDEIEARAANMAVTLEQLADPRTGLSPAQTAQVETIAPFIAQMQTEAQAARLMLEAREPDLDALAARQDAVGRAAGAVLDLLMEGRECVSAPVVITEASPYAPAERCESADPEYDWAMNGPCVY